MSQPKNFNRAKQPPVPKSLLIVDDEFISVEAVVANLSDRGFESHVVHTKIGAELALLQYSFDGLLLDLMLPDKVPAEPKMDPPTALQRLWPFSHVYVVGNLKKLAQNPIFRFSFSLPWDKKL